MKTFTTLLALAAAVAMALPTEAGLFGRRATSTNGACGSGACSAEFVNYQPPQATQLPYPPPPPQATQLPAPPPQATQLPSLDYGTGRPPQAAQLPAPTYPLRRIYSTYSSYQESYGSCASSSAGQGEGCFSRMKARRAERRANRNRVTHYGF